MKNNKAFSIFKKAYKENYAIGQFNFSVKEQASGIIKAAKETKSSIILGTSEGESKFLGLKTAVAIKKILEEKLKFPIFLNLDHGKSFEYLKEAIIAGYDMVHFDGSGLDFKENIKITKKVVNFAKKKNILVEGELGYLRGSSSIHKEKIEIKKEDMTSPEKAKEFVKKTNVDSLAVAIGNVHGIYAQNPCLDLDLLSKIKEKTKGTPLVLHGGSGISPNQFKKAIKRGIVKININTEIRKAWRNGVEKSFKKNANEITPYKLLPKAIEEVQKIAYKKIKLFNN